MTLSHTHTHTQRSLEQKNMMSEIALGGTQLLRRNGFGK